MKRQKNMLQMKEQGKNLQDQINEEEISNLPERQKERGKRERQEEREND